MSIRPIDFQTMVPKVSEQTRVQNENQQRSTSMQQQQAEIAQKDAQAQTSTIQQQSEAEKADIYDKQEKKQNKKKRRFDTKNELEAQIITDNGQLLKKKNTLKQPNEGRSIDIRL